MNRKKGKSTKSKKREENMLIQGGARLSFGRIGLVGNQNGPGIAWFQRP